MGAKGAAAAIGQMVAEYARSAAVAGMQPDDETAPIAPEAEAFKLGLFALVRLKAYDPHGRRRPRRAGQPVTTWWPVAYALQRVEDPRAAPAAAAAARSQRALHACVRRPRPGHPQGCVGGQAAHRPARTRREGRARADGRGDPCAGPARARRDAAAFPGATGRYANRAPQRPAGGRHGPRKARLGRGAADRPGSLDRRVAAICARPRSAPPPPSTRRASSIVLASLEPDRHWRVRVALAETLGTLPA